MTERKIEKQKAFESLEEEIAKHIATVEDVITIFSKIKDNPSSFEEFKAILTKVSYLKDFRGTLRKFDKSDLNEIAGKLTNLWTALKRIETYKK